ncbi:acyltransferase [Conexibacter sp. SYSU D00693]|uniref:acyltransferase family protein n=1 Tax=Conexibacter sp. SYSU D00693 TaxID=2812560 RepID=UPI00196A8D20|nr:acyltransferase [Conexibacter sp. SYSU D00693]
MQQGGRSTERLALGDPVRGLAALFVVVFHVAVSAAFIVAGARAVFGEHVFGAAHEPLFSATSMPFVFFALSAYLLTRPFAAWLVGGQGRPDVTRYAVHRVLRILPAFLLAVLATATLVGTMGAPDRQWLWLAGMVHTWDPALAIDRAMPQAWTLDVEALFYVLLPVGALLAAALLGAVRSRALRLGLLLAALVALGAGTLAWSTNAPDAAHSHMPPKFLFAFTPGLALALLEPLLAPRARASAWAARLPLGLLLVALAGQVLVALSDPADLAARHGLGLLTASALLCAIVVRHWSGAPAWKAIDRPAFHALGRWSYGMYLSHTVVLHVAEPVLRDAGGAWTTLAVGCLAVVPASIVLGALSWRYVERPALRLGDRLAARWRTRRSPARGETVAASAGVP